MSVQNFEIKASVGQDYKVGRVISQDSKLHFGIVDISTAVVAVSSAVWMGALQQDKHCFCEYLCKVVRLKYKQYCLTIPV